MIGRRCFVALMVMGMARTRVIGRRDTHMLAADDDCGQQQLDDDHSYHCPLLSLLLLYPLHSMPFHCAIGGGGGDDGKLRSSFVS